MILIGSRDAGPAEYLGLIAKQMQFDTKFIGSKISTPVFTKHNITQFHNDRDSYHDVQLILTGTCLGNGIDKDMITTGFNFNIKTVAFVDHWTLLQERFLDDDKRFMFSDYIVVNDEKAKQLAIDAGIPGNLLYSLGNPVLENNDISISGSGNDAIPESISAIKNSGKTILFISEQLMLDNLNDKYPSEGYNEFMVLEDIISTMGAEDVLLIKLHPQEEESKYDDYISENILISESQNSISFLLLNSDIVIGMRSMLLLEASNFRQDIISYRPGAKNTFIGNELKVTFPVTDKSALDKIITKGIPINNNKIQDIFAGSSERILSFISGLAEN
jgi:hypothetical protein